MTMDDVFEHNFHEMTNGVVEAMFSYEKMQEKTFADCTTYFANVRNVIGRYVPISICGKAPDAWKGLEYKKLAPKWWFFKEWKDNHDDDFYVRNFKKEVLDRLNPHDVWNDLRKLSNGEPFALVCYEKPGDFCHRHLVSKWLRDAGYEINEFHK